MIKAIIFDCFGVLTKDLWKEFCGSLPSGDVVHAAQELNHQHDAGAISLKEFLNKVHQVTGHEPKLIEELYVDRQPSKNTQLLDYIRLLKKEYKIGMLSNVSSNWVREHFLTPEEQKLFNAMVFSFEVGTTKPDPRMYRVILEKLGVKPEEAVFTDDARHYCDAARQLGMEAIWYEDFPSFKKQLENLLAAGPDN
jgi:epoxide hydrolase-like predicted phosphatase